MTIRYALMLAAFANICARCASVLLPLYALKLGAQPITVGFLAATFSLLPMLLSVAVGRIADRHGARWLLVLAAASAALGLCIPYFSPTLPGIFLAAALVGLSEGIFTVLIQNVIGLLSAPDQRAQTFSNFALIRSIGSFVGPMTAGFAIDAGGHATACLINVVLAVIPLLALAAFRDPPGRTGRDAKVKPSKVADLLEEPAVIRMLAASSLLNAGRDMFQVYLPVYAHSIGMSASLIGVILATTSAAAFIVRWRLARFAARYGEERVLRYAFVMAAFALMLIPFFRNAGALALIAFAFGLGMGCGQPIVTMLMFNHSPEGRSGEGMGLRMTVTYLTRLVAPVAFGSVGSVLGLKVMFWINAAMLGGGSALTRPRK